MVRFSATIEKLGEVANGWFILRLPPDANKKLGPGHRVRGTVAGIAFAGSLKAMGGGERGVNPTKDVCRRAGVGPGDVVEVALEPDREADVVAVPAELAAALTRKPALKKTFEAFSPAHKREYARWIAEAKRAETREARAERALAMIAERRRPSDGTAVRT
jgi:hypothetical protein